MNVLQNEPSKLSDISPVVSYFQNFVKDIAYLCYWPTTLDLTRTTKTCAKTLRYWRPPSVLLTRYQKFCPLV